MTLRDFITKHNIPLAGHLNVCLNGSDPTTEHFYGFAGEFNTLGDRLHCEGTSIELSTEGDDNVGHGLTCFSCTIDGEAVDLYFEY